MPKKLILASASPRRSEILDIAGYSYEIIPSNADEIMEGECAYSIAELNSLAKAREVFDRFNNEDLVVLGADTVVSVNGRVLGKPTDENDAFLMLKSLSGSTHEVISGFAVVGAGGFDSGFCVTKVKFRALSDEEIRDYIATGEPMDKAGAYGIQERACLFAESFEGDFFNIIGLPVEKLYSPLKTLGILPDWQKHTC
ncbi:MAG: septum formation protein Maf [Clostridia bacterium]|nr:septum formation protein Maf [Clostridia bacterium]